MLPSSSADVNARCVDVLACFLETIRNAMVGSVVKVACIYIHLSTNFNKKTFPSNDLKARGIRGSNELKEEVVALTELNLELLGSGASFSSSCVKLLFRSKNCSVENRSSALGSRID